MSAAATRKNVENRFSRWRYLLGQLVETRQKKTQLTADEVSELLSPLFASPSPTARISKTGNKKNPSSELLGRTSILRSLKVTIPRFPAITPVKGSARFPSCLFSSVLLVCAAGGAG